MDSSGFTFSTDELVQALLQSQQSAEDDTSAKTTKELIEILGISDKAVRKRLKSLIDRGVVEHVVVRRTSINGRVQPTDAYRLVAQPEGANSDNLSRSD